MQWQIQVFPDGGVNHRGANLLFGKIFAQNCTKMKECGPRLGAHVPASRSPDHCLPGSTTAMFGA